MASHIGAVATTWAPAWIALRSQRAFLRTPRGCPVDRTRSGRAKVVVRSTGGDALFCFGLGYTGRGLANQLLKQGWSVSGTCQSPEECTEVVASMPRVAAFPFDPTDGKLLSEAGLEALRTATHVLATIPPLQDEHQPDPVLRVYSHELAAQAGQLRWLGYISSTGVYGDRGGGWVDESCEPEPTSAKLRMRRTAETQWQVLAEEAGLPAHIFRVGGIYGPGRSALEAALKPAKSSSSRRRSQRRFTARVHVADVCRAVQASMTAPSLPPGEVFNIVDDDPASRAEVVRYAAALLGVPPPDETATSSADSAAIDEKRVSNRRVKRQLGGELLFPSYRQGLPAILAGDLRPFD